jgi:hypothetical protein
MNAVSEFNQRAYDLFGRPVVQALSNEYAAKLSRVFHPLRLQRWAISDLSPWLWWLAPAAQAVKAQRQPLAADHPTRRLESTLSELTSASLDYQKALRDAAGEAAFFQIYGNLHALYFGDEPCDEARGQPTDPHDLPAVKEALASIDKGGYAEALARVAFVMARRDEPLPLSRLQLAHELIEDYRELLPDLAPDELRRIAGRQEIVVRHEPERAVETLPVLLAARKDRERLLTLLERVLADRRVQRIRATAEQTAMLARLRSVLGFGTPAVRGPRDDESELPRPDASTDRRQALPTP